MSRGVSYASGSVWEFYMYPSRTGEDDRTFGEPEQDFEELVEDIQQVFRGSCGGRAYKSLTNCDKWLGREDCAILENAHAYIGLSEYCGCVCIWCVPKDCVDYHGQDTGGLHDHWCHQVEARVGRLLNKAYPDQMMVSLGHMSNGEQIFRPVNRPEGITTSKEGKLW